MGVFDQLVGWNKLLHAKCNKNQILPVCTMNKPASILDECAGPEQPGDGHYVFATYLEPGYHQFLIYDPLIDKAFCQEMVVDFNPYQQIYPELP